MKPIAGQGDLPYYIGGFCVTAANINGELKYNLNIFKQRSSYVYDLIDTDFNVYTFISITTHDKNKQKIDPSKSATELGDLLPKNTFIIKVNESNFITAFQSNKLKLSTGLSMFKPWDLYFCNIPDPDGGNGFDPDASYIMVMDDYSYAGGGLDSVILGLVRKDGSPYIIARSAIDMHVMSGGAILDSIDMSMSEFGMYTLYYKSPIAGMSKIEAEISSRYFLDAEIHFLEPGTIPDISNCTMECVGKNLYADGESAGQIYFNIFDDQMRPVLNYDVSKIDCFVVSTTGDASKVNMSGFTDYHNGSYSIDVTTTSSGEYRFSSTIDGQEPRLINMILTFQEPLVYKVSIPDVVGVTYGIYSSFSVQFTPNTIMGNGTWSTTTPGIELSHTGTAKEGQNILTMVSNMIGEFDLTFTSSTPYKVSDTKTLVSEPKKNLVPVSGIDSEMHVSPNMTFKVRVEMNPTGVYSPTGTMSSPAFDFTEFFDVIDYDGQFTYTLRSKPAAWFPDTPRNVVAQVDYSNYKLPGSIVFKASDKNGNFN